ncbi:MAG: T9SS type A sorting domain-containing protein [Chitinophagaceae bacterium]
MNFYKKIKTIILAFALITIANNVIAQNQGLYADTIKWPNTNSITINIRSVGFSNIIGFQGSIKWDKNSLQYVSHAASATSGLGASNFSFGTSATAQGTLTYIYSDAVTNHTITNGTIVLSINFSVINNPVSTYDDNFISFSNTPTGIGIDTAADIAGLSDLATLNSPNLERHTSGYVSFARPGVLSYNGTDVTDSVTNRPANCTYQWFVGGNLIPGANSSSLTNAPAGTITLQVTYPNGTVVSSVNSVLPLKLNSFNGKHLDNVNIVSWSTSSEVNTNNFEIEKSINSKDFVTIGKIGAIGNSNITQYYTFTDALVNNASTVYYRLKMNDNNGAFAYSNIIKVSNTLKSSVVLYPNPSKTSVNIVGNQMKQIIVTNILGKVVLQKSLDNVNNTVLNISNLSKGIYNVNIINNDDNACISFIVE